MLRVLRALRVEFQVGWGDVGSKMYVPVVRGAVFGPAFNTEITEFTEHDRKRERWSQAYSASFKSTAIGHPVPTHRNTRKAKSTGPWGWMAEDT